MYLNNGELNGVRLLSRTTVQFMMANQIGDIWGDSGAYYGLAFGVLNQEGQNMGGSGSIGTFDWGGYFNTQYFADPKENIIGILMKQIQDIATDDTEWKFRQLVGQTEIIEKINNLQQKINAINTGVYSNRYLRQAD